MTDASLIECPECGGHLSGNVVSDEAGSYDRHRRPDGRTHYLPLDDAA